MPHVRISYNNDPRLIGSVIEVDRAAASILIGEGRAVLVDDPESPPEAMTKAQLAERAVQLGVEVPRNATKGILAELIAEAETQPGG